MSILRSNNEPPEAIVKWGWKYHHTGVPTDKIMDGEIGNRCRYHDGDKKLIPSGYFCNEEDGSQWSLHNTSHNSSHAGKGEITLGKIQ